MPDAAERALHAQLHEYLQPALDRFAALDSDDEREGFRKALQDFVRCTAWSRRSWPGVTGTWSGCTSTDACC